MVHLKVEKVLEANDISNQPKSTTTSKPEQHSATVSAMHVVHVLRIMMILFPCGELMHE